MIQPPAETRLTANQVNIGTGLLDGTSDPYGTR